MTIYFTRTGSPSEERFREQLDGHELRFVGSLEEVGEEAEMLVILFWARIDGGFLAAHPKLRFIATRSSGYDHIDLAACSERGIVVCSVPSYGENTVAEHTFALILSLTRRLREVATAKRIGRFSFEELRGFDLHGKTLGVIGTGRIGLHVARLGRAFGMEVLAFDSKPADVIASLLGYTYTSLDELLRRSHVLTLHVPLTPATVHLLDREAFAKCREGVIVINTARGGVIDTAALLEALDSGRVAGAGLDVLEDERVFQKAASHVITDQIIEFLHADPSSPEERHQRDPERLEELRSLHRNEALLARPDVVFTPHVAFNSVEAVERIDQVTIENIRAFLAGEAINTINPLPQT
ncbi:MAG: NAD(P)-dependent oxidoreductase [Chthoniobacter sp.]|uniref:NAD(P)-dependent oxidoreductase n=1 Tax=Chthoniobacter sp. TaxID=2510640 RepID=UPI0032A5822E